MFHKQLIDGIEIEQKLTGTWIEINADAVQEIVQVGAIAIEI